MRHLGWKSNDPRDDVECGRASIVIIRPSLTGAMRPGVGDIETDHGYYILTDFDDHKVIAEDDRWDPDWLWIFAPERKR